MRTWVKISLVFLVALACAVFLVPIVSEPDPPMQSTGDPDGMNREQRLRDGSLRADPAGQKTDLAGSGRGSATVRPRRKSVTGTVRDTTGAPIHGAVVGILTRQKKILGLPNPLAWLRRKRAVTDVGGRYELANLKKRHSRVCIRVRASGYTRGLKYARPGETCDFVLGKISTLSGRVTRARDGSPCAGAVVKIESTSSEVTWLPASTRTDFEGRYTIPEVGPGTYGITLVPREDLGFRDVSILIRPGREVVYDFEVTEGWQLGGRVTEKVTGVPVAWAEVSWGEARRTYTDADGSYALKGLSHRAVVRVKAKGYVDQDVIFRLPCEGRKRGVKDFALVRAATVRGRVLGPDGSPVEGAEIRVVEELPREGRWPLSDAEGAFTISGISVDVLRRLLVLKAGHARGITRPMKLRPGENRSGVVLRLGRGGTLSGRVTDGEGVPISEHCVDLYSRVPIPEKSLKFNINQRNARLDANGTYRFEAVPAGRYTVVVDREGYTAAVKQDLVVEEGAELEGVDFTLERGFAISGRVVDSGGSPLEEVIVYANSRSNRRQPWGIGDRDARTGADGTFVIECITNGLYRIDLQKERYLQTGQAIVQGGDRGLVLRMARFCKGISGRIRRLDSGAPVTHFWVRYHGACGAQKKRFFDPEGRFHLPRLWEGAYRLEAGTEEGLVSSESVRVDLRPGRDPGPVALLLECGGVISGRVLAPDGSPASGARIHLVLAAGPPFHTVEYDASDCNGAFRFAALQPGEYILIASHRDWIGVEKRVTLPRGRKASVDLNLLAEGCVLEVRVRDRDGRPVEDAEVQVNRMNGMTCSPEIEKHLKQLDKTGVYDSWNIRRIYHSCQYTDSRGALHRPFLAPGRYVVEVKKHPLLPGRVEVTVIPGVTNRVRVQLIPKP